MSSDTRWRRTAIEMAAIVVSILFAFGVDAWWARGQEIREVESYRQLMGVQMAANHSLLTEEVERAQASQSSLIAAVRAISPDPEPIPADSLWNLIRGGWGMGGDQGVEIAALERLLSLDTFEPADHPTLYRQMITFRSQSGRVAANTERFVTVKERTSDYIRTVSPLPSLMYEASDLDEVFPAPIEQLLRDHQLQSLLQELHDRQRLHGAWAMELLVLADSITRALGSGGG